MCWDITETAPLELLLTLARDFLLQHVHRIGTRVLLVARSQQLRMHMGHLFSLSHDRLLPEPLYGLKIIVHTDFVWSLSIFG